MKQVNRRYRKGTDNPVRSGKPHGKGDTPNTNFNVAISSKRGRHEDQIRAGIIETDYK